MAKKNAAHALAGILACSFLVLLSLLALPARAAETPVTVTFWHAMGGKNGEVIKELISRFNRQNPGIVVTDQHVSSRDATAGNDYNALYRALLENLAAGKAPDIAQVYENWTSQLVEIQAIVPMQDFFNGPDGLTQKELSDFIPVFREANSFDGKLWTLPFNKSIYVLYYNKDAFKRAGLSSPPADWKQFRDAALRLTVPSGGQAQYGLVFTPTVDAFGLYLYSHGGDFLDANGSRAVFNSPVGIQDIEFWSELANRDRSAYPSFNATTDFLAKKGAMYIDTTSRIGTIQEKAGFPYGIAALPAGSTRQCAFAGTNVAIFSQSTPERRKAAWKFVKYLTSPEASAYWSEKTGYLPVREGAIKSPEYQAFLKKNPDYKVGIDSLRYAKAQPKSPAWESIRGIIDDAMFAALSQRVPPKEALESAVAQANDLLMKISGTTQR